MLHHLDMLDSIIYSVFDGEFGPGAACILEPNETFASLPVEVICVLTSRLPFVIPSKFPKPSGSLRAFVIESPIIGRLVTRICLFGDTPAGVRLLLPVAREEKRRGSH